MSERLRDDDRWREVPDVLKARHTWCCWRHVDRGRGRLGKAPYNPATGRLAKSNDPETWVDYSTAVEHVGEYEGLGIFLADGLCGVDLDDVRNPDTGELSAWAEEEVTALRSYTEISPSGTGLHILVWATLPAGRRKRGGVEVYGPGSPKFFTVSGNRLTGTPSAIEERSSDLARFHARYLGDHRQPQSATKAAPVQLDVTDADVLSAAFRAKNGAVIRELFEAHGADGNSEDDARLCSLLAFYSGGDPTRLERFMRTSARYREKWDSRRGDETWLARECRLAVERHRGEYYTPPKVCSTSPPAAERGDRHAKSERSPLLNFPRSDAGNGEAFAFLFGDRLRYDWKRERWLRWGAHLWSPAKTGELVPLAKRAARERYAAACEADDDDERKWSFGNESRTRLLNTLDLARGEPPIADDGEWWDADPALLGCPNGVIELATGTFRPGRQIDRITQQVATPYDPDAECPRWHQFVEEVFGGDSDLIEFVWRAVGYSLSGSIKEQAFFLLHGRGANGKSIFLATLRTVLGDYAYNASFRVVDYACRGEHDQALAQLEGRRFVTASEAAENARLNEDRLKALAGDTTITARRLYHDDAPFVNTTKLWLAVNHRPRVLDDSEGFWRRARLIPFNRRFVSAERIAADPSLQLDPNVLPADRDLADKLVAEAPGILAWAVAGSALWASGGLCEPACVHEAGQSWREEADPLGDFISTCCNVGPGCQAAAGDLYRAYLAWAEDAALRERERLTQTAFGRRLAGRFDKKRATVAGRQTTAYSGVGLLHERAV